MTDRKYSIVYNGKEGPLYDWIWTNEDYKPMKFLEDGSIEYFAVRKNSLYRVKQRP